MNILFLTDNFPPERNAPASRTFDHALAWVKSGHDVSVITTAPNFPEGRVYPGFRNAWVTREVVDGIRVIRVKTYITANEGFVKRTLDYVSFMLSGAFAAMLVRRPDVVVTTSPQFFCAIAGWIVTRLRRLPWVFELRDLWPASIVSVGAMRRNRVIRLLERLELRMYRAADAIVTVTQSFREDLARRGIERGKIDVVLNGVDGVRFGPRAPDEGMRDAWDLRDRFVVGYLGTHGMAHALDKVVEAAELLRERDDIVFLLAGAGARRQQIERMVGERGLRNVRMVPAQPKEAMPALWSVHDLALITLRDDPLFATVIPSKLFEAMGMGIPVLMSLPEGEATQLVRGCGCGAIVPPEDPRALADAIVALADDRERLAAMSRAALAAAPGYSRTRAAERMLGVLQAVAREPRARTETAR